ncbi:MAG: hypothetical protein AVDCRST_MAG25-2292 [uncultured Rubrobacteraceae bacterium]|uniref:Uncharacterized protein n=1 Tax=uncultured Rubrobacteraceae bacterium TaxID=349277 RepID=A0A6J4RPC8_9ACTN|nr:MAG: hypothetical protein AVDCRST_MAG25-2292 [uncultured Rubrobacteraceae bacterium]
MFGEEEMGGRSGGVVRSGRLRLRRKRVNELGTHGWGRRRMEERADEISCHLKMGEACGWRSGLPEDRGLEEGLLDELDEIEGALSVGNMDASVTRSSGSGRRRR